MVDWGWAGIWTDSWLSEQSNFRVWSPVKNLPPDAKVSALIDEDTKQWKRDLILDSFNPFEAQQILNIPISLRLPEDQLIWHWEKDDIYSVRSAYHLLCDSKTRDVAESSDMKSKGLWKEIWRAPVPTSARNFLWRLARNILPTRSNLGKKGINMDMLCPICNDSEENQEHLFMYCQPIQQLWFVTQLGIHVPHNHNLNSWLLQWLKCPDPLAAQIFCITLWKIWKARNQTVFKKASFNPIYIAGTIAEFIEEYNLANQPLSKSNMRNDPERWKAPNVAAMKINVDAGCFDNGTIGWGFLVRNFEGKVSFTATKREKIRVSPLLAEVLGLRWCLQWAQEQHYKELIIETDSEIVVNCLYGLSKNACIDHLILDCKEILSYMHNTSVKSSRRTRNAAAHGMVGAAKLLGSRTWFGNVPEPVHQIVCTESLLSY